VGNNWFTENQTRGAPSIIFGGVFFGFDVDVIIDRNAHFPWERNS
jgi:hypothetical protein